MSIIARAPLECALAVCWLRTDLARECIDGFTTFIPRSQIVVASPGISWTAKTRGLVPLASDFGRSLDGVFCPRLSNRRFAVPSANNRFLAFTACMAVGHGSGTRLVTTLPVIL